MGSKVTCIAASDDHVATANFSGGVHVHALSNAQPCGQFSVPGSLAAGAPLGMFSQNRDEEHTVKGMRWIRGSEQLFCAGSSSAHLWSVDVAASREKTQLPQALAAGDKIGTNKHGGLVCCGNMLAQVMAPAQKTELEKDLPYMRYELIGAADAKGSVGATINGGGFGDTPWGQPFLKTAQGFAKPALTIWLIQEWASRWRMFGASTTAVSYRCPSTSSLLAHPASPRGTRTAMCACGPTRLNRCSRSAWRQAASKAPRGLALSASWRCRETR